jgi:hypothetical protein
VSIWSQGITFWSASSSTYWECRDRPVAGPVALGSPTASSLCSELVGDVLGEAPARPAHEGRREVECVAPRSERLEQLLRTQIVVSICTRASSHASTQLNHTATVDLYPDPALQRESAISTSGPPAGITPIRRRLLGARGQFKVTYAQEDLDAI